MNARARIVQLASSVQLTSGADPRSWGKCRCPPNSWQFLRIALVTFYSVTCGSVSST